MPKHDALVAEIRAYCAAHADPVKAKKWARYFSEGYEAWGLIDKGDPFFNACQDEWLKRYAAMGWKGFLKAGESLFSSGKYEEGGIAIRFLKHYRDTLDGAAVRAMEKWFQAGIANWAHTDVLCGEVIGPVLESGRASLEDLASWRYSPLKFQRRAVPVAMLNLIKTAAPTPPLLDFVRPLMKDPERVVHQGTGWFLRETWKREPAPVEAFLLEWKDESPRLIFQYATEKMTPAARARFRKAKPAAARG